MKTLRTQAIEDGVIPANDDKPQLSKAWNDTVNLVAKLPGGPSKERFQVTWFDDVDQSTAKEEIVHGVLGAGEFSLANSRCSLRSQVPAKAFLSAISAAILRLAWIGTVGRSNKA
jgi:hypothetical protein